MKIHNSYSAIIASPLGTIGIVFKHDKLSGLSWLPENNPLKLPKDKQSLGIVNELAHYFSDPQHRFSSNFHLEGTPFQQRVWQALQTIPSGKTLTYGALAKQLHTGPRAIGQACRTNPLPILIPCHRIVAFNHMGGYSGKKNEKMLAIKQWLLKHELNPKDVNSRSALCDEGSPEV